MPANNVLCVLKCGFLTGVLWSFAQMLLAIIAFETGLFSAVEMQGASGEGFFVVDILTGIWAIGIFSLVRSQFQSASHAASVTVLAWWIIQSLVAIKSGGQDFSAIQSALIAVTSFLLMSIAVSVGALLFEKISKTASTTLPVSQA